MSADIRPLVSVIMPVYNPGRYLRESIASVVSQTYPEWELIMVDDCSTDGSDAICREYERKESRIRYIKMPRNSGPACARNAGMEAARGTYFTFIDADDLFHPDTLATAIESALSTGSQLVRFDFATFSDKPDMNAAGWLGHSDLTLDKPEDLRAAALRIFSPGEPLGDNGLDLGSGVWGALFHSDIYHKKGVHFITDRYLPCEDGLFDFDALLNVELATFIGRALYFYRDNAVSLTRRPDMECVKKIAAFCEVAEKRITDAGFSEDKLLYTYGAFISFLRGFQKNVLLSRSLTGRQKRKWLREASAHPYVGKVLSHYPIRNLPRSHRLNFMAFARNRYMLLMALLKARELLRR